MAVEVYHAHSLQSVWLVLLFSSSLYGSFFQVLSMSRLGGAGAVAPLVADLPSEVVVHVYLLLPSDSRRHVSRRGCFLF